MRSRWNTAGISSVVALFVTTVLPCHAQADELITAPAVGSISGVHPTVVGSTGLKVANLQKALMVFLDHRTIVAFSAPNRPTADELSHLLDTLRAEMGPAAIYGEATRQLVSYFQVQQGLGDGLHGQVDIATAQTMNAALNTLGTRVFSGPSITCNIVSLEQRSKSLRIDILDMEGAVVASSSSSIRPQQVIQFDDASNSGAWCRFIVNNAQHYRATALYGIPGASYTLAIPAQ